MVILLNNKKTLIKRDDVEDTPVLATIPWLHRSIYASFYPPVFDEVERDMLTGLAYQNLVSNLTTFTKPENRCIMLTSSLNGKTPSWISMNLANLLIKNSKSVFIIDADFDSPSVHLAFDAEIHEEAQLTNVVNKIHSMILSDRQFFSFWWDELQSHIVSVKEIPGLFLLTNVSATRTMFEKLDLLTLRIMLMNLKKIFDWIIVDSAPISYSRESQAIARLVDAVVLIKDKNISQKKVQNIQKILKPFDTSLIGVIQRSGKSLLA